MKIKASDIFGILSLFFATAVLGDQQHDEQPIKENQQQKRDPMTLLKDSQ